MKINKNRGCLVAVDGVGNIDVISLIMRLQELLQHKNFKVYCTKEPTNSTLGEFIRKESSLVSGDASSCLMAADRYFHIENEILPKLREDYIVISDCYILSSLALEDMTGHNEQFILDVNQNILKPDLQVVVTTEEGILQKRLMEQEFLMRFEKGEPLKREFAPALLGAQIMEHLNVRVLYINNNDSINENIERIYKHILSIKKTRD